MFFLVSSVRLRITTGCWSKQRGEFSCMVSWMFVVEISASFSMGFMQKLKGFIVFSF